MKAAHVLAATFTATLLLSACSSSETTPQPQSAEPTATEAAEAGTETSAAAPPAPQVGDCYTTDVYFKLTNVPEPQECVEGETTQRTIAVLDLPSDLPIPYPRAQELADIREEGGEFTDAQQAEWDSWLEASRLLHQACGEEVREYADIKPTHVSRVKTDTTGPNQAQWDAGQRWLRCNVAVEGHDSELQALPTDVEKYAQTKTARMCADYDEEAERSLIQPCDVASKSEWLATIRKGELGVDTLGAWPGSSEGVTSRVVDYCFEQSKPFVAAKWKKNSAGPNRYSKDDSTYAFWNYLIRDVEEAWATNKITVTCSIPKWMDKQFKNLTS